ncbi:MAG: LptF/LptG family permease [Alphaproteobacteria bacterium]
MNLILFRYILKQYLLIFLAALFALTSVILLFDTIELLRTAAKHESVTFFDIGVLALLKSPQMIHIILPFVVLIAGLTFFFKFSRSSELIVMRAVGMSAWNFMLPVVLATFLIGVFDITVFNPFSALTAKKYERLEEHLGMTNSNPFSWSENGLWLRETHENEVLVVRAARVRQEQERVLLDHVSVMELSPSDAFIRQSESETAVLSDGLLTLKNPLVVDPNAEEGQTQPEISFVTDFTLERILEKFDEPQTMSFWRFPKFINLLQEAGFSTVTHQMYWHELIAYPITMVAMVFIASVFALPTTTRQGRILVRLILSVLCGFLLYFLTRVTNVLGLSQSLPMILAAWGPALIVISLCTSVLLHTEDG